MLLRVTTFIAAITILTGIVRVPPVAAAGLCFGQRPTIVGTNGKDRLRGTPGNDVIMGRGQADVIRGGGGNDRICAGHGYDKVYAGPGADRVFGGLRIDSLNGGPGPDVLLTGTDDILWRGDNYEIASGDGGRDTIRGGEGFDILIGGPGNDDLDGNGLDFQEEAAPDILRGGAGDDRMRGRSSETYHTIHMHGGPGDDQFEGPRLVVIYSRSRTPVTVDLRARRATGEGSDDLSGDVIRVVGSAFDDVIDGSDRGEGLYGGSGNDTIRGHGGNDGISPDPEPVDEGGPSGVDLVEGGSGDDWILRSARNDHYDGGTGSDTLDALYVQQGGISVDLAAGTAIDAESMDTIVAIENVRGTGEADVLLGDDGPNELDGEFGADRIEGHAGDDDVRTWDEAAVLAGGDGDDIVGCLVVSPGQCDGGEGFDILDLRELPVDEIDLASQTATRDSTPPQVFTFSGMEGAYAYAQRASRLFGDDGPNVLVGSDRSDVIEGAAGDDDLSGGNGSDELDGGDGVDRLDGGAGTDSCTNGETVVGCE